MRRVPVPPLTDAGRELAARYLPLALAVAGQWARRYPGLADEFESEALVALCRAASGFDRTQSTGFAGYAGTRINWELHDLARRETTIRRHERAAAQPHLRTDPGPDRVDGHDLAEWAYGVISGRRREWLRRRMAGESVREIHPARPQRVSVACYAALTRLRSLCRIGE